MAGPPDSERGKAAVAMSTGGTGCDTAGDGPCVDDVDSVSLGATAAGGCVVEPDGALGGIGELVGAIDAPGVAAGARRCLAPRPSMLPVA